MIVDGDAHAVEEHSFGDRAPQVRVIVTRHESGAAFIMYLPQAGPMEVRAEVGTGAMAAEVTEGGVT